jgi:hypothetical protein
MKLRALPQSFWQQPNHPNSLSPGTVYPVLPPLSSLGTAKDDVDSFAAGNIWSLFYLTNIVPHFPSLFHRACG